MLPPGLLDNYKYFIAGGYAVCPALANDIDVFVTVPPHRLDEERQALAAFFRKEYGPVRFTEEKNSEQITAYGEQILKVGIVKAFTASKPIHVLITDASISDVLNSFDISTCRVALLPNGQVVTGRGWTAVNEPPQALRDTPTTAARMEKYRQRFAHEVFI